MARDYKHRAQSRDQQRNRNRQEPSGVGVFRWMLITAILIGFAVFLVYLKSMGEKQITVTTLSDSATQKPAKSSLGNEADIKQNAKAETKPDQPKPPQFDFYTILPKKEVVIPDYEVKTRTREERVGKNKKTSYILQAGSYTSYQDADALKAKLALMGIESKIQKAKVENVIWYRVKIGPYAQIASVNVLKSRLQQNGMKPVVTETGQ